MHLSFRPPITLAVNLKIIKVGSTSLCGHLKKNKTLDPQKSTPRTTAAYFNTVGAMIILVETRLRALLHGSPQAQSRGFVAKLFCFLKAFGKIAPQPVRTQKKMNVIQHDEVLFFLYAVNITSVAKLILLIHVTHVNSACKNNLMGGRKPKIVGFIPLG